MKARTYRIWLLVGLASVWIGLGATGCAGYRLGSSLPGSIRSVYVPTFVNRTSEPELETEATSAAIKEFQRDGTLRIAGVDRADAVLKVTLRRYELKPLSYSEDRATEPSEYRLRLVADVVLEERVTGKVIVEAGAVGKESFELTGDLSSAKQEALPEAASYLAHDIVKKVTTGW